MTATLLRPRAVERIWGRRHLPAPFDAFSTDEPVGEIWFEGPETSLLVKRLFTSAKLSVQVHPSDRHARSLGHPCGKDEAWIVSYADIGATIGLGLKEQVDAETLAAAARSGAIEAMLYWRPVAAGDVIYAPAGTIHAIGPGVELIEIQQSCDVTYRLYDYGRPRELHLAEGLEVAQLGPYEQFYEPHWTGEDRQILAAGGAFVLERWARAGGRLLSTEERPFTLVVSGGSGRLDDRVLEGGQVWLVSGSVEIDLEDGSELFVAYPGSEILESACDP